MPLIRRARAGLMNRRHARRIILRHNGRKFRLTVPEITESAVFNGRLHPLPQLKGTRSDSRVGTGTTEAYLDFCIIRNRTGKFQRIGIPDEHQRQGWASDMVRALVNHYPDVRFQNSSLNEMSGPLFMKLHTEMPEHIAPVLPRPDSGYEIIWTEPTD